GNEAVDLTEIEADLGSDLMGAIRDPGLAARAVEKAAHARRIPLAEIRPALPVAEPGTIICLGLNYVDHIKEGNYSIPEYPALFMRGRKSIMPAQAPMIRPSCSEMLDYEAELMFIV